MRIQGNSFVSATQELGNFTNSLPGAPLSPDLIEYLGIEDEEEPSARAMLSYKLADYVKPCHDLGYCPYGSVVEMMPLPPMTIASRKEHLEYLVHCLETGTFEQDGYIEPLDDARRTFFAELVAEGTKGCVDERSRFEDKAACDVFGHLCPVYFLAEEITDWSFEDDCDDEEDWLSCEDCDDRDECDVYKEHCVMKEAEEVLEGDGEDLR